MCIYICIYIYTCVYIYTHIGTQINKQQQVYIKEHMRVIYSQVYIFRIFN